MPRSPVSNRQRLVIVGLLLVQAIDIAVHAATNQIEPLRITSNLVIGLWVALIAIKTFRTWFGFAAWGAITGYLALNCLFLVREGLTNPNQGDNLRFPLFLFLGVTVSLSLALAKLTGTSADRTTDAVEE